MHFFFFPTVISFNLKKYQRSTGTTAWNLCSIFQKLVKFCYKIKQPAPPSPVFVVHPKLFKSYKKGQIFHYFALWFGLLIFQHCCGTVLRKISLVKYKTIHRDFWRIVDLYILENSREIVFLTTRLDAVLCFESLLLWTLRHLPCGINSKCTEILCQKLITATL